MLFIKNASRRFGTGCIPNTEKADGIISPGEADEPIQIGVYVAEQSEYERQIETLNNDKQTLFEWYCMGEIDVDTYKAEKAAIDVEILRTNNAYAVVAAQAKQRQEEQVQRNSRNGIWSAVTEADGLTPELVDMLIEKVVVFPDKRVDIVYKVKDLFE